jgi:uronate dehydrogenase
MTEPDGPESSPSLPGVAGTGRRSRGQLLITGAAGHIGRSVAPLLAAAGWRLTLLDRIEIPDGLANLGAAARADITDRRAVLGVMSGVDAVLHLGGIPVEQDWSDLMLANIDGTQAVLNAARRAGVRRVVLASSIHAAGFHPIGDRPLPDEVPPRPDTYYGVTKAADEALGSLYHDRYGMDVVAIRIAAFGERPVDAATGRFWISVPDGARLFDAALTAPNPGFVVVWGVSTNSNGVLSLDGARALGYDPQDDGAAGPPPQRPAAGAEPGTDRLGGGFTSPELDDTS